MTNVSAEHLQVFKDILKLDLATCTTDVCIAARRDNESLPVFRRIRLGEPVKAEFCGLVADWLVDYQKQFYSHNLEVLKFDVSGKPDKYQIEHIELTGKPYDHIVQQTQPMNMFQGLDTFKGEQSFIDKMRFYVIIIRPSQGQPVYFYRRYSPKRMLHNSTPLAVLLGNTDEFEKVKTPIFLFDQTIDCVGYGTNLFVLAKEHFYYMFQILNELIDTARATLERIKQRIPIANFDQFERACINDKLKMQKLTSIARRPYLDRLTIAIMKPAIKHHNLFIPVELVNGKEMLRFDKEHHRDILRLLDDDYLTSIMTGQNYEIDAKRDL